ncbi:hypothetical protein ABEB36_004478 [Hypothenemus hampei]|uniref:C2 domain-containing protein n=1 Tax=Hypothenemus hampei TaxID=57062 RepID=A0ABD1F3H2_HYPHA
MLGDHFKTKESLVDKILEQGQKLRNAMVQSILQNDLQNRANNLDTKTHNTPVSSFFSLSNRSDEERNLFEAFLNGDYLTKQQEELVLNTARSIPPAEFLLATERTFFPKKCKCDICAEYHNNNLKCDLRRTTTQNADKELVKRSNQDFLKQVDSIKVILQNIDLNSYGIKKITNGCNFQSSSLGESYFIEYSIPQVFVKDVVKSKSKTDSGLESNDVRIYAKRINNAINLKHTSVHSVSNLYNCDLEDHDLVFTIRYKRTGQKKSEQLGIAKFNFGYFNNSKTFSTGKTVPIYLNEKSTITIGILKVTVQLGVGKIYFGQEFLDAVSHQDVIYNVQDSGIVADGHEQRNAPERTFFSAWKTSNEPIENKIIEKKNVEVCPVISENIRNIEETELLYGFLYISEAQFINICPNSFIQCESYCQKDTSTSNVVYNSSNPLFNFCQTVPLIYDEEFVLKLRENFMTIEFWEKSEQTQQLFGLTRLSLHQFYLGYRNRIILKHLKTNKLPIIGTDWWEPIYSIDTNELIGQVQVLTALGTEVQIRNLEIERGFKDDIVKSKVQKVTRTSKPETFKLPATYFTDKAKVNKVPIKPNRTKKLSIVHQPAINLFKFDRNSKSEKIDVATQSDLLLEVQMDTKNSLPGLPKIEDSLTSFLKLLESKSRPVCMENSTNTEPLGKLDNCTIQSNVEPERVPQMRKTADLLDSLQKSFTMSHAASQEAAFRPRQFKCEILINSANHLPKRRKIKSKTKRSRNQKSDENLSPSTYVTFETMPGEPLLKTVVCPKTSSPQWNFKSQVYLPLDLVKNSQKRLLFKVWKKGTNAVLQPNMQADVVLGFAAVDLSVLTMGFPNVQGWFNIIDFSGKCNGQINIHVNPLEKIEQTSVLKINVPETVTHTDSEQLPAEGNDDCTELLSRAFKRKFTELDEISQRLRSRLSEIVNENSDDSKDMDDLTKQFEKDITNVYPEEELDLIEFESEARKFNENYTVKSSQKSLLNDIEANHFFPQSEFSDRNEDECMESNDEAQTSETNAGSSLKSQSGNLMNQDMSQSKLSDFDEGKQRLDAIVEKLERTLLNTEASELGINRYVSGCSQISNNEQKNIYKSSDSTSNPSETNVLDSTAFQQLCDGSRFNFEDYSQPSSSNNTEFSNSLKVDSSDTSIISNFSDCRPNPDGQGTCSDKD